MKILHGNGFPDEERKEFRRRIYENVLESMVALIAAQDKFGVPCQLPQSEANRKLIRSSADSLRDAGTLPPKVANAVKELWQDEGIREMYTRGNEFFIQDTADYFFNAIDRISDPAFIPSDEDILFTRHRTSEISETRFDMGKSVFRVFDVGGQRSDRLFWAPYFEDQIHAILFISSLASYDQMLAEDPTVNRMLDALVLFESISNHPLLRKVNILLFLNKLDLFEKKLQTSPVKQFFPDFEGPNDLKTAGKYFKLKFHAQHKATDKKIYTHFTTSTDTKHMKVIISAVREIVTRMTLQASGYL
ncbi:guanine nucleotide binding protein, alpha subunit [Phlyctochytrium arcticum]|nr:guanine nucleotide binding protein, alpha subunit [Phlyctochytrium arcticum]